MRPMDYVLHTAALSDERRKSMEIGISTACFYPELLTEESVQVIADLGFKKIEVFLETFSEYEEEYCKRLARVVEEMGLEVYSVHSFSGQYEPYLFDRYLPRREDSWKLFRKVIKGANILGAKCLVFHGPGRKWAHHQEISINDIARDMDRLAGEAADYGLILAWENVYWCLSHDPGLMEKVIGKVTSPNIGFTLDLKQANRCGIKIERYLDIMGSRLLNVHINDYSPGNMCLLPGKGIVDYKSLINSLNRINYRGPLIIEVYRNNYFYYREIKDARNFLVSLTK